MTYVMMSLFFIFFIGLGVLNFCDTCRTAAKLIETYGNELQ